MARTNTRPQAAKPRYDDLDTFGRRDGSVGYRNARYRGKKDPYWPPFATRAYRDAGWDATLIDEGLDQPVFDEEDWDLFDEEEIDPEVDDMLAMFANWDADLEEMFPRDLQPVDDHDPVYGDQLLDTDEFVDYGSYRGVYTLEQGYGLDAVFGEVYPGGNCGFSVRTRP